MMVRKELPLQGQAIGLESDFFVIGRPIREPQILHRLPKRFLKRLKSLYK
jgi:hypothetical protein